MNYNYFLVVLWTTNHRKNQPPRLSMKGDGLTKSILGSLKVYIIKNIALMNHGKNWKLI